MNRLLKHIVPALLLCAITAHVHGATTDLSTTPLVSSANTAVNPNVMFVLDDSGSMDWDFLPDWACASMSRRNSTCANTGEDPSSARLEVLFKNPTYNGVYYDPSTTYTAPTYYTAAGVVDTTTYPSQTGQSVATGGDATATAAARNWKAVKDDAYGVQSAASTKSDLTSIAYHWDYIVGEYCATLALRNCTASSTPVSGYTNASTLRWCSSSANAAAATPAAGSCQAEFNSAAGFNYTYARGATPNQATIVVSGASAATTVSSITVNAKQILSATASGNNATAVAASIASNINKCTVAITGGCTISGYVAYSAAGTVTIGAPQTPANITFTPVVTKTGMTVTPNAFTAGNVPGTSLLTVITPDRNSYPFPGTAAKASTRTDCAGTTCTFIEEMTNYANWWTYYSSRMQMVKSAASIAFFPVDDTYRTGYMSINNGTGSDFLNISEFVPAQKLAWYNKLFAANPGNSTPLRTALSKAGRLYAGKLNGTTLNGSTVVDPMQYSCQQNFTILSTDGYWNEAANPKQVNGTTDIGQQDGGEPKPFNDGGTQTRHDTQTFEDQTQVNKSTAQIQKEILQIQSSTSQLQSRTSQLQTSTSQLQSQTTQLQTRTTTLQTQTSQLQSSTSSLQSQTSQLQASTSSLQIRTSNNGGATYTAWTNTNSCTTDSSGSSRTQCQYTPFTAPADATSCTAVAQDPSSPFTVGTARNCTFRVSSPFANAASCTANATPNGSGQTTQCQYTPFTAPADATSCTAVAQDPTNPFTVGTARNCTFRVSSPFANAVATCNATATPNGSGQTTQCQYTAPTAYAGISSCTPVAQSGGPSYTVLTARDCQSVVTSPFANAASCTVNATPNASGNTTQCQYTAFTAFANVASCTVAAQSAGPNYTVGTARQCQYTPFTAYANVGSCTALAQSAGPNYTVGTATQCQYTAYSGFANASSCTPKNQNPASPFTGPAVNCQTTDTGFVNSPSCAATNPSPNGSGQTITCQNLSLSIPTPVASCVAGTSAGGVVTTCVTAVVTPATAVDPSTCTADPASAANGFVSTNCTPVTTNTTVHACLAATATAANNWTTTTCTGLAGGTSNTLADVAEYYYVTDLRTVTLNNCTGTPVAPAVTGNTLCSNPVAPATTDPYNNVPTTTLDGASWQHMTTFTLGLGASGFMQYSPSYPNDTSGDYFDVAQGTTADPANGICTWQSSGECTWPVPTSNSQTTIDDLWHAGVNGRGAYFSATSPASLSVSLSSALASVAARKGSSAAATTSNPNVTSGDNFVFSSTFVTSEWVGELVRQQLDLTTGVVSATIDWAAQAKLDANAARNIYTFNAGGTDNLTAFTAANYGANTNFLTPHISAAPNGLTQFCTGSPPCLSAADQTSAQGNNLVNFLRGDDTNADTKTDSSKYYRFRTHDLGDIVNAEAVYVKGSLFSFADAGYSAFVTTNITRQGMVYAAANDGMLHAFYAADGAGVVGGDEAWAYIPSFVLPNLYKLADKNYANLHEYFVDGTPVVGDVCTSSCGTAGAVWKTILVGGLNEGGNGYYALDITDPTQPPKALWEFTDTNMGKTYGNPKIAKLKDGTWVVLVTSGYNNVAGDGKGYLYVLNAASGALIRSIGTGVGSVASPSGLAKIAVRVPDTSTDSTAEAVYGGDLFGNLWRFDVNGDIGAAGYDAQLLAHLVGPDGKDQPITAKPELGIVSGNLVVFVGTGRYLGVTDLTNTDAQSFYAIKDPLLTGTTANVAIYDNPRNLGTQFVQQTVTTTTCPVNAPATLCTTGQVVRTSSSNVVNFATNNGWFIDLPDGSIVGGITSGSGSERANTDPTLQLGTLGFTTNVPTTSACTVGGYSYNWFLDYRTGAAVSTSYGNVVGVKLGNALATRPVYVRLPNNTVIELTRLSDGTTLTTNVPIGAGATATRRTSWRELITE